MLKTLLLFTLVSGVIGSAHAAPRTPASGDEVLARIPAAAELETLAPLRRAARDSPGDAAIALALARGYITAGRAQDEPRLMGFALAVLAPLTARQMSSPEALVAAADAMQYLHQFDDALRLLDRALELRANDPQALLMRADLLEVRGDLPSARRTCARLAQSTAQEIAIACLASVNSRSGDLRHSYQTLLTMHESSARLPAAIDVWMLQILAEMADRLGDAEAQRRHLSSARARAPQDLKLKTAYADWLLASGRAADVLSLLEPDEAHDGPLLRLAIAAARDPARSREAHRFATAIRERQALAFGDARHLREQARYLLDVENSPSKAAEVALENWKIQREPEDLRLLWKAGRLARNPAAISAARAWLRENRYEDARL